MAGETNEQDEMVYDYFVKAIKDRHARPLPAQVIPKRHEELLEKIRTAKWNTIINYACDVIPEKSDPPWGVRTPSVAPVITFEKGAMHLNTVDPQAKRQIITHFFVISAKLLRVTITAWNSSDAEEATTFSIKSLFSAIHLYLHPDQGSYLTRRFGHVGADRLTLLNDALTPHTYQFVMSPYDLAVFVDKDPYPVVLEPGWLVPIPNYPDRGYVQLSAAPEGSDSFWKLIKVEIGEVE